MFGAFYFILQALLTRHIPKLCLVLLILFQAVFNSELNQAHGTFAAGFF